MVKGTRMEIRDFRSSVTYKWVDWCTQCVANTHNHVLRPTSNMIVFCTTWVCSETWERRNLCRQGIEPVPSRHELVIIHIRTRIRMLQAEHLWDITTRTTLSHCCLLMYRIWIRLLLHRRNTSHSVQFTLRAQNRRIMERSSPKILNRSELNFVFRV